MIRTDSTGGNQGTLHGNARMSYQGASLKARTIEMDFQTGTMEATGPPSDTAQGGRPVFQRGGGQGGSGGRPGGGGMGSGSGGQSFTGDVLSYNLSTKRGRVVDARTQQRDGYVEGGAVKMYEDSTLFVRDGTYTTCDCPPDVTPSYSLRSSEMKLQGKWVYTGPIQLFLFNVPTPLWLPFGFLPNVPGRRSGPLPPDPVFSGSGENKGFALKNWGWYFALNPYTDLTLRASVWSKGSFQFRPRFRYAKRYEYDGGIELTYRRTRIGESEDPNITRSHEGELRWDHSQDLSPTASLYGDIDLATSGDFARRNSDTYEGAVQQDVSSNVRYSKSWAGGDRQIRLSARQRQEFRSGSVDMTLPNFSFSQNQFKPFKRDRGVGDEQWYEKITTSYKLDLRNSYNFDPRDPQDLRSGTNATRADSMLADSIEQADISWYDALVDRDKYRLATGNDELYDFQASHQIPLRMSFRVNRYNLNLSPNLSYESDWYLNTVRRVAERDSTGGVGEINERTVPGFYARHDFNSSFSAGTELFGTFPVGLGPFQGLRHRLNPSLSMTYRPNFNAPFWGRTRSLRFEDGSPVPEDSVRGGTRYDILDGSSAGRNTERWALSFSLSNDFETKRIRSDTTSQQRTETVKLLDLNVGGLSYNFAADSFRVGRNINVDARTTIDPFNINVGAGFSPYVLRPRMLTDSTSELRIADRLMVAESPLTPARLTSFDVSLSANFSSDGQGRGGRSRQGTRRQSSRRQQPTGSGRGQSRRSSGASSSQLSELSLPWSLNFNFNYSFDKPRKEITRRTATLNMGFTLNVTPLWRIQGNTGYDFVQGELSTTRFRINRSLGCWNMSFHWVPFGQFQQYGFSLRVSSGQLSQLLQLQIPNQGGEGRFGGFGDRLRGTVQGAAGGMGGAGF